MVERTNLLETMSERLKKLSDEDRKFIAWAVATQTDEDIRAAAMGAAMQGNADNVVLYAIAGVARALKDAGVKL